MRFNWSIKSTDFVDVALKKYARYLEEKGCLESTIELYMGNVNRYLRFTGTDRPTNQDASRFKDTLFDRRLARSTLNQYAYAVKAYHDMLGEPIAIRRLDPKNQIPYYFTSEDVENIFSVCNNLKHLAMLQTLFYGCLRAMELCNLDDNDLDLRGFMLHVRQGKGGKDGIAYISEECARTLKMYLGIRPLLDIDGRHPLFFTDFGHRWHRCDVSRMFQYYKKKAGIEKAGGVHVFARHTAATILVANGCDLRHVKELLRHKDIRTTLRYAHVNEKTLREKYNKCLTLG